LIPIGCFLAVIPARPGLRQLELVDISLGIGARLRPVSGKIRETTNWRPQSAAGTLTKRLLLRTWLTVVETI
jgi:hypothetical protein